jgi:glutathione synthase/RimK-type ligase-like ATP-grasp enzyme
MNANLAQLIEACKALGVGYQLHHDSGNLLEVIPAGRSYYFAAWTTPLNDQAICHICLDKAFFYELAHTLVPMPRTLSYFDPGAAPKHQRYISIPSINAIAADIQAHFELPVIVKRNRGWGGDHVFRCDTPGDVVEALTAIYDRTSPRFDYVALAQEHLTIRREYRIIYLGGKLQFAYEKNIDEARFTGNLSPLHFCGFDVAIDTDEKIWLIEANTSPGFAYFIASCGPEKIVELYVRVLQELMAGSL